MSHVETSHDRLERRLRALLQSECPSPMLLGEYRLQLLPADDTATVAEHVAGCPHCRAEMRMLQEFLDEEEPQTIWETVQEVVLHWKDSLKPAHEGLALAGIRGASSRAQTFAAAHLWMALTVQETEGGRKNLLALVTREDGLPLEHGTAWLSQANRLIQGGKVDGAGNLVIPDVEPGEYDLGIQCDGTRVWIRGVSV